MFSANENIQLRQYKRQIVQYVEDTIPDDILDLGVNVMVMQVACRAPGCVPLETAIVIVFPKSSKPLLTDLPESAGGNFKTKILKPMAQVTRQDVLEALPAPAFDGGLRSLEQLARQARDVMLAQVVQLMGDDRKGDQKWLAQYLQQALQEFLRRDCQVPPYGEDYADDGDAAVSFSKGDKDEDKKEGSEVISKEEQEESSKSTGPPAADDNNKKDTITIIGFGSLLSERSSRLTFPTLQNFRLARVPGYRRVFGHPASIFFQRGIANPETLEMSSLSVEYVSPEFPGFVGAIFEVPNDNLIVDSSNLDENNNKNDVDATTETIVPSREFLLREEEFDFVEAPYVELDNEGAKNNNTHPKLGIMCTRSTDTTYLQRWGQEQFDEFYGKYGIQTIWGWKPDSGLRPCAVYLRHCYLAAKAAGILDSFLDETYLVDRKSTIREYVQQYPQVLETKPPPELEQRYNG